LVTRLLALHHADAAALVPVLQPLVSKDGLLTAYPPTNRLVVVDTGANVERLARLLADLPPPTSERPVETGGLPVPPPHQPARCAAADELAGRPRDALGDAHGVKVVAEPRTNTLLVAGPPEDVRRARTLVARLDVSAPATAAHVHVRRLRYADAESLVRVLDQL